MSRLGLQWIDTTMRKISSILLVTCLVLATISGLNTSGEEGDSEWIGVYERLAGGGELGSSHVTETSSGVRVDGPMLTNALRVDESFIEREIGPGWASSKPFVAQGGEVVVEGRTVEFSPLELGPQQVFTWGSRSQIELQERPMWVSVSQDEHGGTITVSMDDDDTIGQDLYIAKSWLWDRGLTWFNVTHEDGTVLDVNDIGSGFVVDVHHFSDVYINPEGLDVKKLVGGLHVSNQGETRWFWKESILEVDVDYNPTEVYEIFLPAGWLDVHVRPDYYRIHKGDSLTVDIEFGTPNATLNGEDYYRVSFKSTETTNMIEILGLHIPAYGLVGGELVPHWGEKRWDGAGHRLEVDIENDTNAYEISVEKEWVDVHVAQPYREMYSWPIVKVDQEEYYSHVFASADTPDTVILDGDTFGGWYPDAVPDYLICDDLHTPKGMVPVTPRIFESGGSFQFFQEAVSGRDRGIVALSYTASHDGEAPDATALSVQLTKGQWEGQIMTYDSASSDNCWVLPNSWPYEFDYILKVSTARAVSAANCDWDLWGLSTDHRHIIANKDAEPYRSHDVPETIDCGTGNVDAKYAIEATGVAALCLACLLYFSTEPGADGSLMYFVPPFQVFGGNHLGSGKVPWLQNVTDANVTQTEIDYVEQEILQFQGDVNATMDPASFPRHLAGLVEIPNTCGPAYAPAVPVSEPIEGSQTGTVVQFFQYQGFDGQGGVYATWNLKASIIAPETWSWGARIWDNQNEVRGHGHIDDQWGSCEYLGHAPTSFHFFTEGGAGRWEEPAGCTITTHWEWQVNGKVGYSMKDGLGGEVGGHHTWGEIESCPENNDPKYESESLIRGGTQSSVCLTCLLATIDLLRSELEME